MSQNKRWPRWLWIMYVLLFALSIPWYLPKNGPPQIWLGLPYWVVLSLAATIAIALLTLWVVSRYWREVTEPPARTKIEANK